MEEIADMSFECTLEKLNDIEIFQNNTFILKVKSNQTIYDFVINIDPNSDKLLVIDSNSIPNENTTNNPIIKRFWPFDYSTIYFNNPTKDSSCTDLSGTKILGTQKDSHIEEIAEIIRIIADKVYKYKNKKKAFRNVLIYGKDLGGFVALQLATLIKNSTSISEVPQLNLQLSDKYPQIKQDLFGGKEENETEYGYKTNIYDLIEKEEYVPKAYLNIEYGINEELDNQYDELLQKLSKIPYSENKITLKIGNCTQKEESFNDIYDTLEKVVLVLETEYTGKAKSLNQEIQYKKLSQKQHSQIQKYTTSRLDIKNIGKEATVEVIETSDKDIKITRPNYFQKEKSKGFIAHSDKGQLDLKLKCINDGKIKISLKGKYFRGKNKQIFPVYIDYTKLTINNQTIFDESKVVWHNTPYIHKQLVKNDEILDVHIEWNPINNQSDVSNVNIKTSKTTSTTKNDIQALTEENKQLLTDKTMLLVENAELKKLNMELEEYKEKSEGSRLGIFAKKDEKDEKDEKEEENEDEKQPQHIPLPGELNPLQEKFHKTTDKIEKEFSHEQTDLLDEMDDERDLKIQLCNEKNEETKLEEIEKDNSSILSSKSSVLKDESDEKEDVDLESGNDYDLRAKNEFDDDVDEIEMIEKEQNDQKDSGSFKSKFKNIFKDLQ